MAGRLGEAVTVVVFHQRSDRVNHGHHHTRIQILYGVHGVLGSNWEIKLAPGNALVVEMGALNIKIAVAPTWRT